MSDPHPAVSVVMPVYNPGSWLSAQLDALAGQELPGVTWELVIADNGTVDGSLEKLESAAAGLDWRLVDATDRRGASHARNVGARAARGEWLFFIDSDDVVEADWLPRMWEARNRADVVTGALDVITLNPADSLQARGGSNYGMALPIGPCRFLPYASSGNMAVPRELFLRLGGWDEELLNCEDVDFSWRAQLAGHRLGFARDAVVQYRYRLGHRALFGQVRRYKAAEAALFRRYRSDGAKRQTLAEAGGIWWWVLSRLPYLALGERRRSLWWSVTGAVVGRLEGSWHHKVWYP